MNCEWRNVSNCDCLLRKYIYSQRRRWSNVIYNGIWKLSLPFRQWRRIYYGRAKQTVLSYKQIVLIFFLTRIRQFWSVVGLWRCGIWQCMRTASYGAVVLWNATSNRKVFDATPQPIIIHCEKNNKRKQCVFLDLIFFFLSRCFHLRL